MHTKIPPGNPNPNRHMVAFYFLRALARISQTRAGRSSPCAQRARRIKRAAYTSIALTAGPRRAWSRAILSGLRGRARCRVLSPRRVTACKKRSTLRPGQKEGTSQVDELRRLVPGGRRMGLCSLLEEAGHYIQCLTAQVQLMRKIADSMSKQAHGSSPP